MYIFFSFIIFQNFSTTFQLFKSKLVFPLSKVIEKACALDSHEILLSYFVNDPPKFLISIFWGVRIIKLRLKLNVNETEFYKINFGNMTNGFEILRKSFDPKSTNFGMKITG